MARSTWKPTPLTPEQQAARDLERARQAWKSATSGVTFEQRAVEAKERVEKRAFRGDEVRIGDGYLEVERGFGISAMLYWRTDQDWDTKVKNPDIEGQVAYRYKYRVEVSWGTMGAISPGLATAQLALYRELTEFAGELEYALNYGNTYTIYGP